MAARRDVLIVVALLALAAVGYVAFRKPMPKPEVPPTAENSMPHPPVTDQSGKPVEMPSLNNLPTTYSDLILVANQNMDSGQYPLAAECYRRALTIDSSSVDVRSDYGACLHGMGLSQRAIEEFRKVLVQDPSHTICVYNLGIVYRDIQKIDSARVYWKRYLALEPKGEAADLARQLLKETGS